MVELPASTIHTLVSFGSLSILTIHTRMTVVESVCERERERRQKKNNGERDGGRQEERRMQEGRGKEKEREREREREKEVGRREEF